MSRLACNFATVALFVGISTTRGDENVPMFGGANEPNSDDASRAELSGGPTDEMLADLPIGRVQP